MENQRKERLNAFIRERVVQLRRSESSRRFDAGAGKRRTADAAGTFGLRQDDDAADRRRIPVSRFGARHARRARRFGAAAGETSYGDRVSESRAVSAPERGGKRRLRPARARNAPRGAAAARGGNVGARRSGWLSKGARAGTVGRPAAARGSRPGADPQPAGAAARRTALEPRRAAARAHARRDPFAAKGVRHHGAVRHARPGGSAVDLRPRGADAGRAAHAGGHARRSLFFAADFIGDAFPVILEGKRDLLRPDQIAVAEDGPLVGTLVSRAFLGASTDWIIDWQGQTLRASIPSAAEPAREIGGEVRFAILPPRNHDE
ncbi:TOBE domain-containing protein [Pyramidobacter sp. CG50-2]|nr:TOBE domain-containing protein [Pyramidobacter sp. CG50-2]